MESEVASGAGTKRKTDMRLGLEGLRVGVMGTKGPRPVNHTCK